MRPLYIGLQMLCAIFLVFIFCSQSSTFTFVAHLSGSKAQ
jgi:hypothetical protein